LILCIFRKWNSSLVQKWEKKQLFSLVEEEEVDEVGTKVDNDKKSCANQLDELIYQLVQIKWKEIETLQSVPEDFFESRLITLSKTLHELKTKKTQIKLDEKKRKMIYERIKIVENDLLESKVW